MKIKKIYAVATLLMVAALPGQTFAACTSYGGDACKTFLCMSGRAQRTRHCVGCSDAVSGYFSIVCFNKHGFDLARLQPGATPTLSVPG